MLDMDSDNTRSFVALTKGTMVSHYRIVEKIGAGGMGEVYLAEDTTLNRKVALKFLPQQLSQDVECRARFEREAKAAAKLDHPNIVPVHEVGEYNGRPFFSMAHIRGQSLREVIKRGKLTIPEAIELTMQVCMGLNNAHESGVVHRDIKPANIIIDPEGRPRIVDFGLAIVSGEEKLTKTGSTLGTAGYMSPEQVEGNKVDHRSDIFSTGVILYEMLTGRRPFEGDSDAEIVRAITESTPEPVARFKSGVTGELQLIIDKALSKDPSLRYQHADGMLADLKRLSSQSEPAVKNRRNLWIGLAAAFTISLVAAMYFTGTLIGPKQPMEVPSIAFLMLNNLGPADDEYLAYGITQDLIVDIARAGLIRVAPLKDVLSLPIEELSVKEIAKKLRVRYVFDGTLLKDESGVRISAQLIDSRDGSTVWANKLHRPNEGTPMLQSTLADTVLAVLNTKHGIALNNNVVRVKTADPEAYEYYLRAEYILAKATSKEDYLVAMSLSKQAFDIDSSFLLALEKQASICIDLDKYEEAENGFLDVIEKARKIGDKYVENKSLNNLGIVYYYIADLDKAAECFEKSLSISKVLGDKKGVSTALSNIGMVYGQMGRESDALAYMYDALTR